MTDKEKIVVGYHTNSAKALAELQQNGFAFLDSSLIWQILIYEFEHYDIPTNVFLENLSQEEIITHIKKYFAENGLPIESVTLNSSIIPDEFSNDLIKAEIKFKGEIWVIHKNDKDTFPSQPHAHNYERQYKLHLGNGKLYRNKKFIRSIRSKDLINLRQTIIKKIEINLPLYENN